MKLRIKNGNWCCELVRSSHEHMMCLEIVDDVYGLLGLVIQLLCEFGELATVLAMICGATVVWRVYVLILS